MRTLLSAFALLVLLILPQTVLAENYPQVLGISHSELQKRTGNASCEPSENPFQEGGVSWFCRSKTFSGMTVNEDYLIGEEGEKVVIILVAVLDRNLTAQEMVQTYRSEFIESIRLYGKPRLNSCNRKSRPANLVAEISDGRFSELAIWHVGEGKFLFMLLNGGEGKVNVIFMYATQAMSSPLLRGLSGIQDTSKYLLPDNGH